MRTSDTVTKLMLIVGIILLIILIVGVYMLVFSGGPDGNGNIVVQLG